ncbi:hypothetical protein Hte_006381 [Hypoxylon texense]
MKRYPEHLGWDPHAKQKYSEAIQLGHTDVLANSWRNMVNSYSKLVLSFEKDRLRAVAGIADQLLAASTKLNQGMTLGRYVEGLWENSMLEDLCWRTYALDPQVRRVNRTEWKAPSWSWASVQGDSGEVKAWYGNVTARAKFARVLEFGYTKHPLACQKHVQYNYIRLGLRSAFEMTPNKEEVVWSHDRLCYKVEVDRKSAVMQLTNNQPYILRGIFGDSIALPPSMLQWLISQPESQLSAKWAQMDVLNIPMTLLRADIGLNPVHEPLIRRNLTAHLDNVAGDVWEEVGLALEDIWGTESEAWREINLDYTIRRVVARAVNRVFVGGKLCGGRDNDYIKNSVGYVTRVATCGYLINLFPSWLKRPVGAVFTIPIQIAYAHCAIHLVPMFSDLIRSKAPKSLHLFSSWLVSNSENYPLSSPERTPDFLSRRIMAVNFAAIHTSTYTACNLLLDIFSHSPVDSLLHSECLANSTRWDKTWNRARLNQMFRLDSALRESLRLWGVVAKAMSRKVIHPDGIILPNGQRLPQGATIAANT